MFLSSLFDVPVAAAGAAVTILATTLYPLFAGASTAAAIICFTLAIRVLLLPLSYAQMRGERARFALQPKIRELQDRYRNDPERLQREMVALYGSEGGAMFAGCLPTLAQLPFFFVLYRLFTLGSGDLLGHGLLGVPLGNTWLATVGASGLFGAPGLVFLGLFGLLGLVGWWTSRRMRAVSTAATGPVATLMRFLPFGTIVVAAVVPLAAGLYLLTSTAWTAAERTALGRLVSRAE